MVWRGRGLWGHTDLEPHIGPYLELLPKSLAPRSTWAFQCSSSLGSILDILTKKLDQTQKGTNSEGPGSSFSASITR